MNFWEIVLAVLLGILLAGVVLVLALAVLPALGRAFVAVVRAIGDAGQRAGGIDP